MSEAILVKPDRKFAKEIMDLGGESVKKCFQCATCSVVCDRSPADRPFPRKEMVWAQWGLKDKLAGDPDIWLCYRCGDCTVRCPRGAKPGNVLAALRDKAIEYYAFPAFLGKAIGKTSLLPVMLAIPAVLIGLVIAFSHRELPVDQVNYGEFFPHWALQGFFGGLAGLATIAVILGVKRFWKDMNKTVPEGAERKPLGGCVTAVIKDVLLHGKFKDCTQNRKRYFSHLLTFWGFAGLFITTVGVVISAYIFRYYPIESLWHPLKILGHLSTIAILAGILCILFARLDPETDETSTGRDWSFIGILLGVVVTGAITEALRFINIPPAAYTIYFIHLVLVFALLIYLPYSRFAHMVYRTVALVHAKHTGRED